MSQNNYREGRLLISQEEIEARAQEIGAQITKDYAGKDVLLIGILTGSVLWLAQVVKSIKLDTTLDFMSVSSYGASTKSSGVVKINKDLNNDIEGKHVIIVEDIVDSGMTLEYLCKYLSGHEPASLKICTMLDKPSGRRVEIEADYIGFEAPDAFLIGYGLDADQRFRNLPYIAAIEQEESGENGGNTEQEIPDSDGTDTVAATEMLLW
ncbi:hypoxanthine phosphoribosyltransferase [Clostridia bacterium]|nr:hypoxanthine phosphoribosyltransferase [Clostridia bacterium]